MMSPIVMRLVQARVRVLEDHLHALALLAQPAALDVRQVAALVDHAPGVGRMSCRIARPVVLLPQPLSPTRPRVSPRLMSKVDPVDRVHGPDLALEHHPARDGEVDAQVLDADEGVARVARCGVCYGGGHAGTSAAAARSLPVWKHALCRPGSVGNRSGTDSQQASVAR